MDIRRNLTKEEMFAVKAPSATRLLRRVFNTDSVFEKIPKSIMKEAQERGTWVHAQIENHINGEEVEDRWEWQSYLDAFHEWEAKHKIEYLVSEWIIADQTDFHCKGILDALAYVDGELCLIDFKTSAKPQHMDWELQMGVYAYLLYKEYGLTEDIKLRIIMLGRDGRHKMLYYNYDEANIKSLIRLYNYKERMGA